MKPTNLLAKGLAFVVLVAVALASPPAIADAGQIKIPVGDPVFGGGNVHSTPSLGDDPKVTHDRDYGMGDRRDVGLNPPDQIKIPVRDDYGLLAWFWKIRFLLDVTPV
jgi:hypothetical protein